MRWYEQYTRGQRIEMQISNAAGEKKWHLARVVRVGKGNVVVELAITAEISSAMAALFAVTRKGEIRCASCRGKGFVVDIDCARRETEKPCVCKEGS